MIGDAEGDGDASLEAGSRLRALEQDALTVRRAMERKRAEAAHAARRVTGGAGRGRGGPRVVTTIVEEETA
jgi:hypothetical protein